MSTATSEPNLVPADVPTAIDALGIGPCEVRGDEVYALCPWHDDRNVGSFSVNIRTGLAWCWSCENGGSFLQVVRTVRGCRTWDAAKWLLRQGVDPTAGAAVHRKKSKKARGKADQPFPITVMEGITEADLALFVPPPVEELEHRFIDPDAAAFYGVLWDADKGKWILPFRDLEGTLHGWQAKKGSRVRNVPPRYRGDPHSVARDQYLFGGHVFDTDTLIVVESPLDVARILSAGIFGAVATYGKHVSDEQLRLMVSLADRVILAMDDDDAGHKATWGGQTDAGRHRRGLVDRLTGRVRVYLYDYGQTKGGKDPGEHSDREIHKAIDRAIPSFQAVR